MSRSSVIVLSAVLYAGQLTPAAVVSAAPAEAMRRPVKGRPLSAEERQHRQTRVKEVKEFLKEARAGKRDDAEKYVLLRHLLMNYAILEVEDTDLEVREAKREWDELLRKHPEFKSNPPPLEIKEQRALREQTESRERDLERKAESFVPKDTRAKVFWSGNRLAAIYQFRIEFFDLPENVEPHIEYGDKWQTLRGKGKWQGATFEIRFMEGEKSVALKPTKTITFGEKISAAGGCQYTSVSCEHLAVYTEGVYPGYSPSDQEEWAVIRKLRGMERTYKWNDPRADFQEFYGVLTIAGKILVKIPFQAAPPDKIAKVLHVYPDGTAVFGVGSAIPSDADPDHLRFGAVKEIVSWSKMDGVKKESASKAKERFPELKSSAWLK